MSAPSLPRVVRGFMWVDYFLIMPVLARLSWGAALWWGRRRGDLLYCWRRVGRRAAVANLLHAYAGRLNAREARRIARRAYQAQTCEEAETFLFGALRREEFRAFVRVEGQEHLEHALARGRGAIVFSLHYGSLCLAMIALAYIGYRVNVLARSIAEEENPLQAPVRRYAARKVADLERILGRPFIIAGAPDAMLRVRRALKEGEIVYVLLDVPPELANRRVRVRFLGHPAELPHGAELIAKASGAALLPFVVRRNADGRTHTFRMGAEVPVVEGGESVLQRCIDELEGEIRADPSQFFMWEFARSFWIDEGPVGTIDHTDGMQAAGGGAA